MSEADYRAVGHIIPGIVTYIIGLIWIWISTYDYVVHKRTNKNFETRLFIRNICQFKSKCLKIFNLPCSLIGIVAVLVSILLFFTLTK